MAAFGAARLGAPMDEAGEGGATPLMEAAWRGSEQAARALFELGADPLRGDPRDGVSPWDRMGEGLLGGGGERRRAMRERWELERAARAGEGKRAAGRRGL